MGPQQLLEALDPLTEAEIRLLAWCVRDAASWRGALTGNPDPRPLALFDRRIERSREALRKLRQLNRAVEEMRS